MQTFIGFILGLAFGVLGLIAYDFFYTIWLERKEGKEELKNEQ